MAQHDVTEILDAYMVAALWSSLDNRHEEDPETYPENLDGSFTPDDIAEETREEMRRDVESFVEMAGELLDFTYPGHRGAEWSTDSLIGHDFWLTRNGHGAGFWDRGLGDRGEELTKLAQSFSGVDLYAGDDGKVYA